MWKNTGDYGGVETEKRGGSIFFMRGNNREKGREGERRAVAYLEEQGYVVERTNFYCPFGEVDVIAREGDHLVFVEVKYRSSERYGHPLEAVSPAKQRRIIKCSQYYLVGQGLSCDVPLRFDVVAILGDQITLVKNAFEAT